MSSRETARTPRQVFGAMLRYYRERAGLSRAELARQISKSVSLIQAIELGQRAATADVTEDLERVLPTDGALTRLRDEIGDGFGYQAYPSWFQDWLVTEREAKKLRWFEPLLVPGLLQTEDYARAIFRTRFGTTDEEIDEQVAARLKRQEILTRDEPPAFWVIVDESVLRRPVGGRYVMREQVGHLIEAAQRPHVSIQVISVQRGCPPWLVGGWVHDRRFRGRADCRLPGDCVPGAARRPPRGRRNTHRLLGYARTRGAAVGRLAGATGGSGEVMDISNVTWRKASYSGDNGGGCVEVGVWRKPSYSGGNGGDCVEVASTGKPSSPSVTPKTQTALNWPLHRQRGNRLSSVCEAQRQMWASPAATLILTGKPAIHATR